MSALYLANEPDRTVWLAAEQDGKLYGYVPNVDAFVYNEPMTVDFLIDRELSYVPVTAHDAIDIIHAGVVGKIDGRTNRYLLDRIEAENRRLSPTEVLGANTIRAAALQSGTDPTATETAKAKADILRRTPPGRWMVYRTYPPTSKRQTALQLASDLRKGRVKAFADIPVKTRVLTSDQGHHIVQITRGAAQKRNDAPTGPAATTAKADRTRTLKQKGT